MTTPGEALEQARQLVVTGQLDKAVELYRRITQVEHEADELWNELAILHLRMQQLNAGVDCLRRAVALSPNNLNYHAMLGTALQMMKRPAEAVDSFERALEIGPPAAQLFNNLALALKDAGRTDDALRAFDEALTVQPDYVNGHFNRGNLLFGLGRLDEAVADYRHAARLAPDDAAAMCKLGMALYDLGRLDEALSTYNKALQIKPDYPDVRRNRALIWLSRGQYVQGWPEYEWRLKCDGATKRSVDAPRGEGQDLKGCTLFVYAEQGLGDALQFIRYLPLVLEMHGSVLADVHARLVPLLAQSGFGQHLVQAGSTPTCDFHCPLMSLPGSVPATRGEPYWGGRYLAANPQLVAKWKDRLREITGFKIGIAWAGNPDHPHDRFRSADLRQFAPLATVPGARLISLQKGPGSEQLAHVGREFDVVDLGPELDSSGAFMDTAAVMQNLDLVITVDTAVAHLAGGLGVRVWVSLEYSPDWRWLSEGDSTVWYPSMRLFRQRELGGWPRVFAEMAVELPKIAATTS